MWSEGGGGSGGWVQTFSVIQLNVLNVLNVRAVSSPAILFMGKGQFHHSIGETTVSVL